MKPACWSSALCQSPRCCPAPATSIPRRSRSKGGHGSGSRPGGHSAAMLYYVVRELHRYTIDKFLTGLSASGRPAHNIGVATYETLFALKRAPIGNYIFTDIDRLTSFEIDAAGEIAKGLRKADP